MAKKVRDLLEDLAEFPLDADVRVAVEHVEGHDVRVVKNDIDALKFEDDEVIVELG